ncbi:MAG TPA: ribosome biogenesis GTPase Der [Atribacteraceae bacterium]|nr:ribosome biogenesis GTPase Der [Atribacteraceae bacterium]
MTESLPLVVIAGRANVGKSTLFNRLSRKRLSIVDASPGVTRDILENRIAINGQPTLLVDTGGIEFANPHLNPLQKTVEEKAWSVLRKADLILFIVDGNKEVTNIETDLLLRFRKEGRKVILVINKREGQTHQPPPEDIYTLGLDDIVQISAAHGDGIPLLKELIIRRIERVSGVIEKTEENRVRLAILGKPNVGKSTLFNALLGERRSLVSDIPGTTRDAVESWLDHNSGTYILIDTAGIARKASPRGDVSFYAAIRAWKNLKDAHVCLLVLDLESGLTRQDKRIAHEIAASRKGCLVFLNKYDLRKEQDPTVSPHSLIRDIQQEMPFLGYALYHCGSALDPAIPNQLLPAITNISEGYFRKIPTSVLNHSIKNIINDADWLLPSQKHFRVYYAYQEFTAPPRFIFFTNFNGTDEFRDALARKISRLIRKETNWEGVPLTIEIKNR